MAIMKPKQINTAQAKDQLNKLIAEVDETRKPIIIEKRGEPIAAIIDIKTFREKLENSKPLKDDAILEDLNAFHQSILKEKSQKLTGDSIAILHQLRKER